jgi:hypothetical protein
MEETKLEQLVNTYIENNTLVNVLGKDNKPIHRKVYLTKLHFGQLLCYGQAFGRRIDYSVPVSNITRIDACEVKK